MSTGGFRGRLTRRARAIGVTLPPDLVNSLDSYYRLLASWNAKINLTGFKLAEPSQEAIDRLFLEPVTAATHIQPDAATVLDVGSGGGSPAIPLMLSRPALGVTMVESKTRKSVFLREATRALGLASASVITVRVEELLSRPELHEAFDVVTIRAVRLEPSVLWTIQAFLKPAGEVLLFGGRMTPDSYLSVPMLTAMADHELPGGSTLRVFRKRQVFHVERSQTREP